MAMRASSEGCKRSGPSSSQDCEPTDSLPVPSGVSTAMSRRTANHMSTTLSLCKRDGGIFSAAQKAIRPPMTMRSWRSAMLHGAWLFATDMAMDELSTITTPRPARTSTTVRIMV